MASRKSELLAGFAAGIFSLAYLATGLSIPEPPIKQQVGPEVFPRAIGILMLFLSGVYMLQQLRGVKEDKKRAEIIGAEEKVEGKADLKTMGIMTAIMLLYAVFFELLGYAIATFLAFMAGIVVLNRKHLVRDTIIALVAGFGLNFIFTTFLRVNLPAGLLGLFGE